MSRCSASTLVCLLLSSTVLAGCIERGPEAAAVEHAHGDFVEMQRLAASSATTCTSVSTQRFIVQFRGLVDFASKPGQGVIDQDDLTLLLVNATNPSNLPVKNSHAINTHTPELLYPAFLKNPQDSGLKSIDLTGRHVRIVGRASQPVKMHREPLVGDVPSPADRCSLDWAVLIDEVAPGSMLRPDVFNSPSATLVTSRVVVEEGEAYTVDVFKTSAGSPCVVGFPGLAFERAVARSIAVAVPADEGKLTLVIGDVEEVFELPSGMEEATLILHNHTMSPTADYDFAGHLALRQDMDSSEAVIPIPSYADCEFGVPPGENPQCSPANNTRP